MLSYTQGRTSWKDRSGSKQQSQVLGHIHESRDFFFKQAYQDWGGGWRLPLRHIIHFLPTRGWNAIGWSLALKNPRRWWKDWVRISRHSKHLQGIHLTEISSLKMTAPPFVLDPGDFSWATRSEPRLNQLMKSLKTPLLPIQKFKEPKLHTTPSVMLHRKKA